jgi:hypothetical protein
MPTLPRTLAAVGAALLTFAAAHAQTPPTPPDAKPSGTALPRSSVYDHPLLQKKVSLSLKDADINAAVKKLSEAAGISLVVERVATLGTRPLTLELKDATLGEVLDAVGTVYGYRWRRKGEVFLLSLAPSDEDDKATEEFAKQAAQDFYDSVLTPEQRALVDSQGYIEAKDLTPGQKGAATGFMQEMFRRIMSSQLGNQIELGRIDIDLKNKKFGITAKSPDEKK